MRIKQFGRSMIEMLGVLAIIGVLSIGGIALYRRAINNHHANTILDDVNRFAFVITEKGNYPLGEDLPKADFKESGIYSLTAHQAAGANQFSILVSNVPKGVCEPLVDKANIDYKVGVVAAGGSVDDEIIYDSLNTDLCQEMNDVVFYFGDTSLVCNSPEGNGPCTTNADCCGGEFCAYVNATHLNKVDNGNGECRAIVTPIWATLSDGQRWVHSKETMNWYSAQSWCASLGLKMTTRTELNCSVGSNYYSSTCEKSSVVSELKQKWGNSGCHWLNNPRLWGGTASTDVVIIWKSGGALALDGRYLASTCYALCH